MLTPDEITRRFTALKNERAQFETLWQDLAEHIRPLRAEFTGDRQPGEKRTSRIFDSAPAMAADNFASGIYGMMTNPANVWFALKAADEDLNKSDAVKRWLDVASTRVLSSFSPAVSKFYNEAPSLYLDLGVFGTAVFYSEEIVGKGRILDCTRPLSECYIAENELGDVDTVYRKFKLSARNALSKWGNEVSAAVKTAADRAPDQLFEFCHAVYPNTDYREGALGPKGKPVVSHYIELGQQQTLSVGGYEEMPYFVPRWAQAAGETYGRGVGDAILPDAKMLHRMQETTLRAAQKAADPPLGAPDEGVIRAARTYPGGITYGAVNSTGQLLLRELYQPGRVDLSLEMIERVRASVRDAFYFSLMQMVGSPNMTATEWLGRQEEKLRLMGPHLGRIQAEFLSPLIRRRFGMLLRAGHFPDPPQELQGQTVVVEYVSPLAKAQKSSEGQSVERLLASLSAIGQVDPQVFDNVDADEALRVLADAYGTPMRVMKPIEAVEKARAERAQQQNAMSAMMAGQQGADMIQKLAGAQKAGGGLVAGSQQ